MSEELKRIAIDNLVVEITRKCQLKCAHCLKGDAQNVDMSVDVIDVNSLKWVKYYSPEGKQPNMLLFSRHLSILKNIIGKYK